LNSSSSWPTCLVEEFFFRGYLMGRFCEWLGDIKGMLLNAVIFSLAHMSGVS